MIKLVGVTPVDNQTLELRFSDGSHGEWSAAPILARRTAMTRPLEDPNFFRRAYIDAGALAWPNGLDFSPRALREELARKGKLVLSRAA